MSNRVDLLRHDKPQKTCRDCYHWMACKTMLEAMGFVVDGDGKDADKRCNEFQAAADVAPVVHGRWIDAMFKNITTYYVYRCSECDHPESFKHKHCPNCGARMDGKDE